MTLSVIIPTHNVAPWLGQCLKSVLGQQVRDIEVFCVDDGSTDETAHLLREWVRHDGRVRLILQRNARQGAARNRGIDRAQGKYLAFVDGDDWVAPDMWRPLIDKAERDRCEMVLCEGWRVDEGSRRRFRHAYECLPLPSSFFRKTFTWREFASFANPLGSCVCPPLRICRRDFIGRRRFPLGMLYEDVPFHLALFLRAKRLGAVRGARYYYRQHTTSTMAIRDARVLDYLRVLDLLWEDLGSLGLQEELHSSFAAYAANILWKTFAMWPTEPCFEQCAAWCDAHLRSAILSPEEEANVLVFREHDFIRAREAALRVAKPSTSRLTDFAGTVRDGLQCLLPNVNRNLKQVLPYGLMARWLRARYGISLEPAGCIMAFLPYGVVMMWRRSAGIVPRKGGCSNSQNTTGRKCGK